MIGRLGCHRAGAGKNGLSRQQLIDDLVKSSDLELGGLRNIASKSGADYSRIVGGFSLRRGKKVIDGAHFSDLGQLIACAKFRRALTGVHCGISRRRDRSKPFLCTHPTTSSALKRQIPLGLPVYQTFL